MGTPFKLKGMDFGNSQMRQKQTTTNVKLSKHENKKGTRIIGGSTSEEINDLEMRIEDLNSDLQSGGKEDLGIMEKGKIITQINKLKAQLKKITNK